MSEPDLARGYLHGGAAAEYGAAYRTLAYRRVSKPVGCGWVRG
ncbi:hypothetical protein [Nocardia brasiliensis]|nr:hypothetical protein [Nocardia brasiliensis]